MRKHTHAHTIPHLPIIAVWTPLPLLTINLPPLGPQPFHHPHPDSSLGDTTFCTRTVTSEPYFSHVNHDLAHPEDLMAPSSPFQLQPFSESLELFLKGSYPFVILKKRNFLQSRKFHLLCVCY